jgi:hypothetical protein
MIDAAALALLLAAPAAAVAASWRAQRREWGKRRDLLADCVDLLENSNIEPDRAGFGVLRGRLDGRAVALRPFVDTLTFRRLPQLWLAATVADPVDGGSSLEVLRRQTGAEFYAAGDRLPVRHRPPESWPRDSEIRSGPDGGPLLARLAPALAPHLERPQLKSAFVSPRGARIVWQAAQGSRGAFLLFRDSRFPIERIARADAEAALAAAFAAAGARHAPASAITGVDAEAA